MKFRYGCSSLLILILLLISNCTKKTEAKKQYYYFDLEGFFDKEAERLQAEKPAIQKSVLHNLKTEEKIISPAEWDRELELFKNSDINKPAWRDSYSVNKKPGLFKYIATDPSLRTKEIIIYFSKAGQVTRISVHNRVENILYASREQLEYMPDSLYSISKIQQVKFLGENTYKVSGKFAR